MVTTEQFRSGTGGFRALEGRSPLSAGGAMQARLSGLPAGATYEVWVRPVDANGRVGDASPARRGVGGSAPLLFLPVIPHGR